MSEATTAQPAAMPSSRTMPKDSPCSDGRAQHVGPGQPGRHLLVAQHAQPVHPVRRGVAPALHLGGRTLAGHPQDGRPLQHGEGVEQDAQALALLVASEEQHDGPALCVAMRRRRLEALHVDAVEQHLEVAAARAQPVSRAASDTATRICMRRPTSAASGSRGRTHRLTPARW